MPVGLMSQKMEHQRPKNIVSMNKLQSHRVNVRTLEEQKLSEIFVMAEILANAHAMKEVVRAPLEKILATGSANCEQ